MPAELDREEGYERGHDPDDRYRQQDSPVGDPRLVVERVPDVDEPIQTDRAEVQDRRRGAHHVRRHPDPTDDRSEYPTPQDVVHHGKGHDSGRHHRVGQRQGHEEVVARLSQSSIRQDSDDDEEVSGDGGNDESAQDDPYGNALGNDASAIFHRCVVDGHCAVFHGNRCCPR